MALTGIVLTTWIGFANQSGVIKEPGLIGLRPWLWQSKELCRGHGNLTGCRSICIDDYAATNPSGLPEHRWCFQNCHVIPIQLVIIVLYLVKSKCYLLISSPFIIVLSCKQSPFSTDVWHICEVAPVLLVPYTRFVVGIRPFWEFEQSSNGRRDAWYG